MRFKSEIVLEDYNLMDIFPAWKEHVLGTLDEKIFKLSDPTTSARVAGRDPRAGRRIRRGSVPAR